MTEALKRLHYTVWTEDGTVSQDVEVRWADQLLAEREAGRHGITRDLPLHMTSYWCWAALKRTGQKPPDFQVFLADAEIVPDDRNKDGGIEVPPTPAPSDSA